MYISTFPIVVTLMFKGVLSLPSGCVVIYDNIGDAITVDCSKLGLRTVPKGIPTTVQVVLLNHNNISRIPNDTFVELLHLQHLDLSWNNITSLVSRSFSGLKSLKELNLSTNRICLNNNSYSVDVFKDLKQLTSLNIKNNTECGSKEYPDIFSHLVDLKSLLMDGFQDLIPGAGFRALANLEILDFSGYSGHCFLMNISKNMFENVNTDRPLVLNISLCRLQNIHPEVFKSLPTLTVLDLQDNGDLGFDGFMKASQNFPKSLKVVNITMIYREHYLTLHGDRFKYLKQTNIERIVIDRNWIYCIDPDAISNLPTTVTHLSFRHNRLMDADFLLSVIFMPKLKFLDIGKQLVYSSQNSNETLFKPFVKESKEYCDGYISPLSFAATDNIDNDNMTAIKENVGSNENDMLSTDAPYTGNNNYAKRTDIKYSNKSRLYARKVDATSAVSAHPRQHFPLLSSRCDKRTSLTKFPFNVIPLPPYLHTLKADFIKFGYAIPNVTFNKYNTLQVLNLSSDILYCLGGPVYGLRDLQVFDLSSNQCNSVSPLFFIDMPSLTHLYLQNNNIGQSCAEDTEGQMFSSQKNLKVLHLDQNRITSLPRTMFKNLVNLEFLNLSQNSLANLGARIGHMRKLKILDLSHNQLFQIKEDTRQDLDRISATRNVTVNIIGNSPLKCNCDTLDFLQWMTKTSVIFENINDTTCSSVDGEILYLRDLNDIVQTLWLECKTRLIFIVVLIMFVCMCLCVAVSSTLYYKRWKLRYLYYIGRRRVNPYHSLGNPVPDDQTMDVFVSYDEDDRDQRRFVQEVLLSRLEVEQLSCLISEVHFLSGRNTREIIAEAVLGTKKTLVLLTNDFFKSRDRELEFNMAVLHGMETRQELVIPVAMETLRPDNVPREVREFLKAYPCIPYREDGPSFWQELVSRIRSTGSEL